MMNSRSHRFIQPPVVRRTTPPSGSAPEHGYHAQRRAQASVAASPIQESDDVYCYEIALITFQLKECRQPNETEEMENAAPKLDYVPNGDQAYARFKYQLTEHEKFEIRAFPEVHFAAPKVKKIEPSPGAENNGGFDDEDGSYKTVMGDHLYYRYELISKLGAGVFGTVYKAHDHKTKINVAVKILKNTPRFRKIGDDEIKILKSLGKFAQYDQTEGRMTHLVEAFTFRQHPCLVFDLCAMNVYTLIKTNHHKGFSLSVVRKFALGLLRFLSFIHSKSIMHCDLKPENILLKSPTRTGLQVCDFNISCHEQMQVYAYIQSRFYRAPEVILQPYGSKYNRAIDMWSFGCIIAEFYLGNPLFPGRTGKDQLAVILEGLGLPSSNFMKLCSNSKRGMKEDYFPDGIPFYCQSATEGGYTDSAKKYFRLPPGGKPVVEMLKSGGSKFVDFVLKALAWDPEERMTAEEALNHPWITTSLSVDAGNRPRSNDLTRNRPQRQE